MFCQCDMCDKVAPTRHALYYHKKKHLNLLWPALLDILYYSHIGDIKLVHLSQFGSAYKDIIQTSLNVKLVEVFVLCSNN